MESIWTILTVVVVINFLWLVAIFAAQKCDKELPLRNSIIPGTRQKFLHMQNFNTMTWGDAFGIPLISNAFVWLAFSGYISSWQWVAFCVIVFVDGIFFWRMCLGKNHKDDAGYHPKITLCGLLHLPYHGVNAACAIIAMGHMIFEHLPWQIICLSLAGALIYLASFFADIKSGNFNSLKLEEDFPCSSKKVEELERRMRMSHEDWNPDKA